MKNIYIKVKPQETTSGGGDTKWVRPADWLTLPSLTEGQQKVVGLHAVWGDSDFAAVLCAGAYTVDWGDGTVENIATDVKTQHLFNYASLEGTECSMGYRQAIVTITPQSGQNLTTVNFQQKHSQASLQSYSPGWLDIAMVGSSISALSVGGATYKLGVLCQFSFIGSNLLNSSISFQNCYSLQSIPLLNTSSIISFTGMFQNCYSLQSVPLLNTSSGVSFNSMFMYCYSLLSIPLLDTSSGTSFSQMFYNCSSLSTIPLLDTSSGTSFSNMIGSCPSLSIAKLAGTPLSISYSSCKLSASQLTAIFDGLATVTGQTITISNNWGTANLTAEQKAIATNKGWTLTL